MPNWRALARIVDKAVDGQFSEAIIIKPMAEASDLQVGAIDPSRAQIGPIPGVVTNGKAMVASNQGGVQATADYEVSIVTALIPDYVKQGDHVVIVERDEELEIVLIDVDAISRTKLHLVWMR